MKFQTTMKALSDPTRREILKLLRSKIMSASEIADHFQITNASISYHLSLLKEAGLVIIEKKGKYIYYEINTTVLDEIMTWVSEIRGTENEK